MDTLFSDSEVFQKQRPTKPTQQQLDAFYEKMAKEIIFKSYSQSMEETIIDDLKKLRPRHDNGFEMAKELDVTRRYKIDTEFCEWLDNFSYEFEELNTENIRTWVKAHDIKPLFENGTRLKIVKNIHSELKEGDIVFVTGAKLTDAYYTLHPNKDHNGGYVVDYEVAESKCLIFP